MSPVCKKCRNYVMNLPCPHCGGDQAFTERKPDEIKPIIPLDLQGSFKPPPPPIDQINLSNTAFNQLITLHHTNTSTKPPQIPSTPSSNNIPSSSLLESTLSSLSSTFIPPREPLPNISQETTQNSDKSPPISPVPSFQGNLEGNIALKDVQNHFKQLESYINQINSKQHQDEKNSQKMQSNMKEIDRKLKRMEKSIKILLKTNQNLESIYKSTTKDLKKVL